MILKSDKCSEGEHASCNNNADWNCECQCHKIKGYFCGKCNEYFQLPYYCIHKYSPEAPKFK